MNIGCNFTLTNHWFMSWPW